MFSAFKFLFFIIFRGGTKLTVSDMFGTYSIHLTPSSKMTDFREIT